MMRYQYEITTYTSDEFSSLVYFCTDNGNCSLDHVSPGQIDILKGILNDRGVEGWELLQLIFRNEGVIAFWKRQIDPES